MIGLGVGNVGAQGIADGLLAGQITAAEEKLANEAAGGGKYLMAGGQSQTSIEVSKYKPVSDIQVNLGADTLTQIIILALVLAAVSSVVGIVILTKYEPLKILRERN
jgi:putative ABC transport system permease protein